MSVNAFTSSKYSTSTNAAEGSTVLMRRQSCVEAYAEDAQAPAPSGVKQRAAIARRNSLPPGVLVQPLTQKTNLLPPSGPPVTAV